MNLKINRWYLPDRTMGLMSYGDFNCVSMELPWLGNKKSISCISAGIYEWRKHVSPSNGPCIEILNVYNRTHIQIHSANFTRQILGCVAVGDGIKDIDNDGGLDVTNSKNTLSKLLDALPDKGMIEIGL